MRPRRAGARPAATAVLMPMALAGLLAVCAACTATHPAVSSAVRYEAAQDAAAIQDLSAVVGGEKRFAGDLQPGTQWQGSFAPGLQDDRQLHLLFRASGRRRLWSGPAVPVGADYRIEVRLLDGHAVRFRHCQLPCDLSTQPWREGSSLPND